MEANAASASIKGKFRSGITLFTHSTWSEVEVVIDYEYLSVAEGEEVIKELSVASENVHETFRFLPPYVMDPHSSDQNSICWDDGSTAYSSLFQTLAEATANFAHLYAKGTAKCKFVSNVLGRSVQNLDTFGCPECKSFRMTPGCSLPCYKIPDKSCAARNTLNFYGWLKHHIQDKEYVKCPKDNSRHTAIFNSGVEME